MGKANLDIRAEIVKAGLRHWQVAKLCGIHEGTFSKWLREELPEETKRLILSAINNRKDPIMLANIRLQIIGVKVEAQTRAAYARANDYKLSDLET